jgi:predicted transposase YbfD/YdcC
MASMAADGGALEETVAFLGWFRDLPDPRQRGKVIYPLDEVLLLCLLAVLAGAETFVDIARFGGKKLGLLQRFRPFRDGTPSHGHLGDIFAALDAEQFQRCFVGWVAALTRTPAEVIAIDGKTVRRSYQKSGGKAPIHMVSAFAARQRLVLGQVKVADKSNEIVAIPKLLDLLAIEGAVVTIDAMGCQRGIAQKIIDKKADYVLALKGNQGSLREDVELFVAEQAAKGFTDIAISRDQTVDGDHGRIETRTTTVIHDAAWLQERHDWPGLKGIVVVKSLRELPGPIPAAAKIECETRFYVTSLASPANLLGPIIRSHWAVENSLHWIMDMTFRDDECRIRTDHAPANFTTIKHIAHNLIRKAPGKDSLRLRRKVAAWDDDFLAALDGFRGGGLGHATRAATRAPSRALPRRRALCTNWKKPR